MSEVTTFGDLARQGRVVLNDGYRTRVDELGEPGVPILRVAEVKDGFIAPSFGDHVREEFRTKFAQKTSAANDVVVTTKGTVGRVALIGQRDPEFVYSPQVCFFRCGEEAGVLAKWLYYWFKGPEFAKQARGVQSQTDMAPYINLADMRALAITVPPEAEQRAIAGVLGALDDKIESNRRIWRTRQDLARAHFARARAQATDEVELGELYSVGLSGVWGEESPSGAAETATICLRGRDLEDYVGGQPSAAPLRYITERQRQSRTAAIGEIWTAGSGSLGPALLITDGVLRRWRHPLSYSNFVKRLVPTSDHRLHAIAFHAVWEAWTSGGFTNFRTGTAMPNLDPDALLKGVWVPTVSPEDAADVAVATDLALDPGLLHECDALVQLRDALLPELLLGRLRVRDVEIVLEGAV